MFITLAMNYGYASSSDPSGRSFIDSLRHLWLHDVSSLLCFSLELYQDLRKVTSTMYGAQSFPRLEHRLSTLPFYKIGMDFIVPSIATSNILEGVSKTFNTESKSSLYFSENYSCLMKAFIRPFNPREFPSDLFCCYFSVWGNFGISSCLSCSCFLDPLKFYPCLDRMIDRILNNYSAIFWPSVV